MLSLQQQVEWHVNAAPTLDPSYNQGQAVAKEGP